MFYVQWSSLGLKSSLWIIFTFEFQESVWKTYSTKDTFKVTECVFQNQVLFTTPKYITILFAVRWDGYIYCTNIGKPRTAGKQEIVSAR